MIVKTAAGRSKDLETLTSLLNTPLLEEGVKKKISQEIRLIQSGERGEREAAYEIDFHYGNSPSWAVIHDLRIEHGGRVAQIDHLLINRFLEFWVCESKRFNEGVSVNYKGEFAAFYGSKPYGIPSPIEQNKKHIAVLRTFLEEGGIEFPRRLGFTLKPTFKNLVLVSKNARISRPAKNHAFPEIIKVDQLKTHITSSGDDDSILLATKIVSTDTLSSLANQVIKANRSIEFNWQARFGLTNPPQEDVSYEKHPIDLDRSEPLSDSKNTKLTCSSCGDNITYAVAKFCRFNKPKFNGKLFCFTCQKNV